MPHPMLDFSINSEIRRQRVVADPFAGPPTPDPELVSQSPMLGTRPVKPDLRLETARRCVRCVYPKFKETPHSRPTMTAASPTESVTNTQRPCDYEAREINARSFISPRLALKLTICVAKGAATSAESC